MIPFTIFLFLLVIFIMYNQYILHKKIKALNDLVNKNERISASNFNKIVSIIKQKSKNEKRNEIKKYTNRNRKG